MADEKITARLLGVGGADLGSTELEEVTRFLRMQPYKDQETGMRLVDVFIHQSASRSDAPVFIYAWSEGEDTGKRVRVNPEMVILPQDPSDDDSGYGPDSYFGRAMQKDD